MACANVLRRVETSMKNATRCKPVCKLWTQIAGVQVFSESDVVWCLLIQPITTSYHVPLASTLLSEMRSQQPWPWCRKADLEISALQCPLKNRGNSNYGKGPFIS